jgi:ATP-dependent exoDNAse (exonuclease V) beta subunit
MRKVGLRSVTSLVHSDDDKSLRESFTLEAGEDGLERNAGGKAFGILTHQLLEKGWGWEKETLQKAAKLWGGGLALSPEDADLAADLAARALEGDLLTRAKRSPHVFRELSLTGKGMDGSLLNAVVDLAFLEEEEWVVVDYKTDRELGNLDSYRKQVGHYGDLLEKLTGRKTKESWLYFLRQDQRVRVK